MPSSSHTAGEDCQDSTRFLSKDGSKCSDYDESVCDCSFVECAFADADSACAIECETCDPGLCLCLEFSKHQSIRILIWQIAKIMPTLKDLWDHAMNTQKICARATSASTVIVRPMGPLPLMPVRGHAVRAQVRDAACILKQL